MKDAKNRGRNSTIWCILFVIITSLSGLTACSDSRDNDNNFNNFNRINSFDPTGFQYSQCGLLQTYSVGFCNGFSCPGGVGAELLTNGEVFNVVATTFSAQQTIDSLPVFRTFNACIYSNRAPEYIDADFTDAFADLIQINGGF